MTWSFIGQQPKTGVPDTLRVQNRYSRILSSPNTYQVVYDTTSQLFLSEDANIKTGRCTCIGLLYPGLCNPRVNLYRITLPVFQLLLFATYNLLFMEKPLGCKPEPPVDFVAVKPLSCGKQKKKCNTCALAFVNILLLFRFASGSFTFKNITVSQLEQVIAGCIVTEWVMTDPSWFVQSPMVSLRV